MIENGTEPASGGASAFVTTHWSVVLAAGRNDTVGAPAALEKLCSTYWYPLYAYVRRRGYQVEDAQDLTQEFFARVLERHLPQRREGRGGARRTRRKRGSKFFVTCSPFPPNLGAHIDSQR